MYFKNHGNFYGNLKYIHVCTCHTTQSRFLAYYSYTIRKGQLHVHVHGVYEALTCIFKINSLSKKLINSSS